MKRVGKMEETIDFFGREKELKTANLTSDLGQFATFKPCQNIRLLSSG